MLTEVSVESASAYSKIEKSRNISVLRLLEISKALEVDVTSWFEDLEEDNLIFKEESEKLKEIHDIYLLVNDLKREILLLKKEIAGIKPPAKTRRSSKIN